MLMHFLDAGKVSLSIWSFKSVLLLYFSGVLQMYPWFTCNLSVLILDDLQFGSLEEFQEEFRDINQEEQISRLHKMLAPHLLRSTSLEPSPRGASRYLDHQFVAHI